MTQTLGSKDTQCNGADGPEARTGRVMYVPPSLEVIEQLARAICQRLAATNPMLDVEKVVHEFTGFLGVLARMHARYLNQAASLDSEGRSE